MFGFTDRAWLMLLVDLVFAVVEFNVKIALFTVHIRCPIPIQTDTVIVR